MRKQRGDHAPSHAGAQQQRQMIAFEAARLISNDGIRDYAAAKRKAAERLGMSSDTSLPANSEIEAALREHQRLFLSDSQPLQLRRLREAALEAMHFFAAFEPRLVGAVLDGTADEHSAVCLHLFSDDPDAPQHLLDEHGIRHQSTSRRLRVDKNRAAEFPVMVFQAGSFSIDLTLFPHDSLRQAPLDRIDEKPMRRATRAAVEQLLDGDNTSQRLSTGT